MTDKTKHRVGRVIAQTEIIRENVEYRLTLLHPETREVLSNLLVACTAGQWPGVLRHLSHLSDYRESKNWDYLGVASQMRNYLMEQNRLLADQTPKVIGARRKKGRPTGNSRPTVSERLLLHLKKHPDDIRKSAPYFAKLLMCSKSAITGSETWKKLVMPSREHGKKHIPEGTPEDLKNMKNLPAK